MIENLNGTHETVNYRENTSLRIYDNGEYEEYPLHWHSPIEILMPVRSEYVFEYNDALCTLREGDIAIICPAVLHHLFPSEGERYIIQAEMTSVLNLREISSILSMIYPAAVITPEQYPDIYPRVSQQVREIMRDYQTGDSFFESSIYSRLIEIFVLLGRNFASSSRRFADDDSRQKKYVEKFIDVCSYIEDHCTENLSLEDAARFSGFSKYHFTRLFKQFTGTTYYRYLNQKRIARAEQALADPALSITDVAMESGFPSMSAFIRMFHITKGCTPSQFRKMYHP